MANSVPAGATITGVSLTMRDVMGLNGDRPSSCTTSLQDWGEGTSFQNGGMGAAATNDDATWLYTFYNASNPSFESRLVDAGRQLQPDGQRLRRS